MRFKVAALFLLVGIAGIVALFVFKPAPVPMPSETPPVVATNLLEAIKSRPVPSSVNNHPPTSATLIPDLPSPRVANVAVEEDQSPVQQQIDRLTELQANDDDESLQAILRELTNTNKYVRHAAIESAIQFGGHSAVPVLQDLANRTTDVDEKKELQDAAEFLTLPSLSELRAQNPGGQIVQPQIPPPVTDGQ